MVKRWILCVLVGLMVGCSSDENEPDGEDNATNASPTATAAPLDVAAGAWQLAEVERLPESLDEYDIVGTGILSPDGSAVAWEVGTEPGDGGIPGAMVCVYQLETEGLDCPSLPETYLSDVNWLTWSGDGERLYFTENALELGDESDIWEYNVVSQEITNRTDDDKLGLITDRLNDDAPVEVDYLPTWNAGRNQLYFLRSVYSEEEGREITLELYRLADGDQSEQVRDLTEDFPRWSVHNDMVFSPDGDTVALLVFPVAEPTDETGIWLLNLDEGRLQHVATLASLQGGESDFQTGLMQALQPVDVNWAGDGGLVVFMSASDEGAGLPSMTVYVDVATGGVTPLVDISGLTNAEMMTTPDESGHLPMYYLPRRGLVSADGSTFFTFHQENEADEISVSAIALPPDGNAAELIGTQPADAANWFLAETADGFDRQRLVTMTADGRALVGRYLLQFAAN